MKILFIVPYTPNLIRVRPYQLVRTLVRRGHQVTVAALWSSEDEKADLRQLAEIGVQVIAQPLPKWRALTNVIGAVPTAAPLQAAYCWQPTLADALRTLWANTRFDVVHVEHLRGARYGLLAQTLRGVRHTTPPIIWDSVDCISHLFEQAAAQSRSWRSRLMTNVDLARTKRYEGALVHQFDQVTVTSPVDKTALAVLAATQAQSAQAQQAINTKLHVLPNGVDLEYFTTGDAAREPATLVFSGKMSYHANVTAALHLVQEIMPRVWAVQPRVKVWLVGKDPAPEIQALATPSVANGNGAGQVVVTGTVPDLRPYLQRATLAVAPVPYGAGIQNKVLEAMACGAAVIASPQACSALPVRSGQEVVIAETPATFAQAILDLIATPPQIGQLGQAARAYVEAHHSWDAIVRQLETIYRIGS
jgi:glycosyltransferase involved in cell wall biosynthesis